MELDEFRIALTYWLQLNRNSGAPVATLWEGEILKHIQQSPRVTSKTTIKVPVVELLRSKGTRKLQGQVIVSSIPPTEACIGMARMGGADGIYYLQAGKLYLLKTTRRGGEQPVGLAETTSGPFPEVTPVVANAPVAAAKPANAWLDKGGLNSVMKAPTAPTPKWYKSQASPLAMLNQWVAKQPTRLAVQEAGRMAWGVPAERSKFTDSSLEYLGMRRLVGGDQLAMDNVLMMLAIELVARGSGFKSNAGGQAVAQPARMKSAEGQRIGSLLADVEGNVLGWGFNTNKENSTRHGEVNLLAQYLEEEESLPAGGTIYTTLEPCEMCSGMIVRAVKEGEAFRVIYGQADGNVENTALQKPSKDSKIVMSATQAHTMNRNTATATGSNFAASMAQHQQGLGKAAAATTAYLKRKDTYEQYLSMGRPAWWMYLWDNAVAQLERQKGAGGLALTDPAVVKMNNELTVVYDLVERFMNSVTTHAVGDHA